MTNRIRALLRKELIEISRRKASLLPIALVGLYCLALAFGLTILIPAFTGEKLGEDPDFVRLSASIAGYPSCLLRPACRRTSFSSSCWCFCSSPSASR